MRTSIKIILVYLLIQFSMGCITNCIGIVCSKLGGGNISDALLLLSSLLSMLLMVLYMRWKHYFPSKREAWSKVSYRYLIVSGIMAFSLVLLSDAISSFLYFLPDLMKSTFDSLSTDVFGIILVAVIGPVFEEILFRGAITRYLLEKFTPRKAILISALIFGLSHINPAQMIPAFLIGIILAWLYYSTKSMVPGMIIHILNNGCVVLMGNLYPGVSTLGKVVHEPTYAMLCIASIVVVVASLYILNRIKPLGMIFRQQKLKE